MKNVVMEIIGNVVVDTDSYKFSHFDMYPNETETIISYFECRNGAKFDKQKFFGLQPILNDLSRTITKEMVDEADEICQMHGVPFNKEGWMLIVDKYNGKLPIRIRAVPEGTVLEISNALIIVENFGGKPLRWLTNYVETMLSRVWYPITVATLSYQVKQLLKHYLWRTADTEAILDFQLHDFGSRGVSCREQAGIGGMAHLTNFLGTDTVIGMVYASTYYDAPKACGYSVKATEHSIMTSLGEAGEKEVIRKLLLDNPTKIMAMVIDSFNHCRFISEYAKEFKDVILARDGKVVFRPDSGDPVAVSLDVFNRLWGVFGGTVNKKGFKVLNPKVGMLWGDGIDIKGIDEILLAFEENGISSENIVFGMGGGLLQKLNRDTMRCAFKCCAQIQDGKVVDIFKNPIDQSKTSKKGLLKLVKDGDIYKTVGINEPGEDIMETVFENGVVTKHYTMDEIRKRSW